HRSAVRRCRVSSAINCSKSFHVGALGRAVRSTPTNGGQSFIHPNPDPQNSTLSPFGVNNPIHPRPSLSTNAFRLQNVRAIAADPTRAGNLYVAEADETTDN